MTAKKETANKWLTPQMIATYVMAFWAAFASYQNFQNDVSAKVRMLEREVTSLKQSRDVTAVKFEGRSDFMVEATKRIEHLCERSASCERRYEPLEVPH